MRLLTALVVSICALFGFAAPVLGGSAQLPPIGYHPHASLPRPAPPLEAQLPRPTGPELFSFIPFTPVPMPDIGSPAYRSTSPAYGNVSPGYERAQPRRPPMPIQNTIGLPFTLLQLPARPAVPSQTPPGYRGGLPERQLRSNPSHSAGMPPSYRR